MIQSEQIVFSDTFAYHVYSGRGEGKKLPLPYISLVKQSVWLKGMVNHKVVENICSKVVGSRFIGFPPPER